MYIEPNYENPDAADDTTKIMNSVNGQLTRFVSQMWLEEGKLNWLLNFFALGYGSIWCSWFVIEPILGGDGGIRHSDERVCSGESHQVPAA